MNKAKKKNLKGEQSTSRNKLDIKRHAKMQAKELLDTQKCQIESTAIKCYKECLKYYNELEEFTIRADLTCLDKVAHTMTEKGFRVVILILNNLRRS